MFPTVGGGDSGEILATACQGAPSHPPGYPFLGIMNRFAIWLGKVGGLEAAWTGNFFSCIVGSLAGVGVFFLSSTLMESKRPEILADSVVAATAAIGFGLSRGVWEYVVQAEVFPLNNLLCSLLLWTLVKFVRSVGADKVGCSKKKDSRESSSKFSVKTDRIAVMGGFLCGLCVSNQHTSIIYVIVCVMVVLSSASFSILLKSNRILMMNLILATLLGLTPYCYIVYRAKVHKPLDGWGDQSTLEGFTTHFFRKEYGTFKLASEWESGESQDFEKILRRLGLFFDRFASETYYVGPVLALVYFLDSVKRKNYPNLTVPLAWGCYLMFFNFLANLTFSKLHLEILSRMWQQSAVAHYAMCGAGGKLVLECIAVHRRLFTALFICMLSLCVLLRDNYTAMNRSHVRIYYNYAQMLLSQLPENAMLLVNDDMNCNTLHYLTSCSNIRPDITFIRLPLITYEWWKPMQLHHHPGVNFPGTRHHPRDEGAFNMKTFLDANYDNFEIYVAGGWKTGDNSQDVYKRVPVGLADAVVKEGSDKIGLVDFGKRALENFREFNYEETLQNPSEGSWELVMITKYQNNYSSVAHHIAGKIFAEEGRDLTEDEKMRLVEISLMYYKKYLEISRSGGGLYNTDEAAPLYSTGAVYRNAGVMAAMLGKMKLEAGDEEGERDANLAMFRFWEIFYVKCWVEDRVEDKDCKEVEAFLLNRVNPHSGKVLLEEESFGWMNHRFGKTTKGGKERITVKLNKEERKFKRKRRTREL